MIINKDFFCKKTGISFKSIPLCTKRGNHEVTFELTLKERDLLLKNHYFDSFLSFYNCKDNLHLKNVDYKLGESGEYLITKGKCLLITPKHTIERLQLIPKDSIEYLSYSILNELI